MARTYTYRIYQKSRRGEQEVAKGTVESQRNSTIVATNLAKQHLGKEYGTPPSADDEFAIKRWQDELRTLVVELVDEDDNTIRHSAHNLFTVPKKKVW